MDLKEKLREIALGAGADYFGVASVNRWEHAPIGHRPLDLLPQAKSVIVIGVKIPQGAIESNNRAFEGLRHGIFSYMIFGYNLINDVMNEITGKMSQYLEEQGIDTFLLPASTPRDELQMAGVISNRHAAVCAGLADIGWNGLAMTQEDGPRVRWAPLIVATELEADPLYTGKKVCLGEGCRKCMRACPVAAFSATEAVEVIIEERSFKYSKLNRPLCRCGVTGLAKGTPGRLQADIPPDVNTVEDWLKIASTDIVWNQKERFAAMCGRCLLECVAGDNKR